MGDRSELKKVGVFESAIDANLAQQLLADYDIQSFMEGEHTTTWLSYVGTALGGVRLMVRSVDAEQAVEILRKSRSIDSHARPWRCGRCQVVVDGGFEICWSCGQPKSQVEMADRGDAELELDTRPIVGLATRDRFTIPVQPDPSQAANPFLSPMPDSNDSAEAEQAEQPVAIVDRAEDLLMRAWRAAVFGVVFVPIIMTAYSFYLLVRASLITDHFSTRGTWRFYQSLVINVLTAVVWLSILFHNSLPSAEAIWDLIGWGK